MVQTAALFHRFLNHSHASLISAMSESAAIVKLFFRSTIAQNDCRGYTTSDRGGG